MNNTPVPTREEVVRLHAEVEKLTTYATDRDNDARGMTRLCEQYREERDAALLQVSELQKLIGRVDAYFCNPEFGYYDGPQLIVPPDLSEAIRAVAEKPKGECPDCHDTGEIGLADGEIWCPKCHPEFYVEKGRCQLTKPMGSGETCALEIGHRGACNHVVEKRNDEQTRKEPTNMCASIVKVDNGPIYCYQPIPCRIHG